MIYVCILIHQSKSLRAHAAVYYINIYNVYLYMLRMYKGGKKVKKNIWELKVTPNG